MSSIGGQRSRIARANFSPSIEPGMSMSVKTMQMSFRASKMAMASSALDTSIALYPAASTKSAACIRLKNSSSTTRTYGCDAAIKVSPGNKSDASNSPRIQNPGEGRTFQVLVSRHCRVCQQERRRRWQFGPLWFPNSRTADVEVIHVIGGRK
jgi:hypothetical protein